MRINSGIVLSGRKPYVTQGYENSFYLGNPLNCIDILSSYDFDELAIINKSHTLDCDYLNFLTSVSAMSKLPISITGNITKAETCYKLIEAGFERVQLNALHFDDRGEVEKIVKNLGKQSLVLKLDLEFEQIREPLLRRGRKTVNLIEHLTENRSLIGDLYSEVNLNIVPWDGKSFDSLAFNCLLDE